MKTVKREKEGWGKEGEGYFEGKEVRRRSSSSRTKTLEEEKETEEEEV